MRTRGREAAIPGCRHAESLLTFLATSGDELWPFQDRKSRKFGNPPFGWWKPRTAADNLLFVF
jgi:hypothetical protein